MNLVSHTETPLEKPVVLSKQQQLQAEVKSLQLDKHQATIYRLIHQYPQTKVEINKRSKISAKLVTEILKQLADRQLIKKTKLPQFKGQVWVLFDNFQAEEEDQVQKEKIELVAFITKQEEGTSLKTIKQDASFVNLNITRFDAIVRNMELKGEIYIINDCIFKREVKLIQSPCIQCQHRDLCSKYSLISPQDCPHLLTW